MLHKLVAALCCLTGMSCFLSGCATDAQRTQTEGAVAGAAIGAGIGAIAGGKEATVVGAAAGTVIGGIVGSKVAADKAEYARREDALRASAERANLLAEATRQHNTTLTAQLAELQKNVQRLRTEKMSATARKNLTLAHQTKVAGLMQGVDTQLAQVRDEVTKQQALLKQEQRLAQQNNDQRLQPGMQQVAMAIRDLQTTEQALERAKAQLQLVDQKRAYSTKS